MNPDRLVPRAVRKAATLLRPVLPPTTYQSLYVAGWVGYWPNVRRPRTFNEKILWLMRHHRDPLVARCADKLQARAYALEAVPWITLPELYGVYERASDIPFDRLPDLAVLKSNHASGHVQVLRRPYDVAAITAKADAWLAERYGDSTLEWHYGTVTPKLFVEEFLSGADGDSAHDHKLHVINGRVERIAVLGGRFSSKRNAFFDREWRPLPAISSDSWAPFDPPLPKPVNLDALIEAAERLAAPFPYARADLYRFDDKIVFGELTFFPNAGRLVFVDRATDLHYGDLLRLPPR